ncbi:MarR family transcriptional regulator [Methanogenium sp. S4BF]|uniref:MarR family winged helix-turn-helix transcriptional regulator n=1 Tax=Methanogenium sp. S4BF TaxID=1789226 RepID=UPI0024161B48|nr:MarR family transcriptional regulator [Methanogenium sp. S4BF]WFN34027.1 MarR family transcriptional regulator [Methanogenium sp. S4BF]
MNSPLPPDLPTGALISIIYRSRNRVLSEWALREGISAGVVSPLLYLAKHPDATQDEISRRMTIDKAAIARAIHRLEEDGYLIRTPDERNRRKFRIFLTETGKYLAKEATEAADEIDREIIAGLPEEARAHLMPILRSMAYTSSCMADREAHNTHDTDSTD